MQTVQQGIRHLTSNKHKDRLPSARLDFQGGLHQSREARECVCDASHSISARVRTQHQRAWYNAQDYQRLLGTQPTRRLNPSKIAESSVIKNKLVDTIAFLENMSVKVTT